MNSLVKAMQSKLKVRLSIDGKKYNVNYKKAPTVGDVVIDRYDGLYATLIEEIKYNCVAIKDGNLTELTNKDRLYLCEEIK